jgi:REP element-mobilizing transposase RayT
MTKQPLINTKIAKHPYRKNPRLSTYDYANAGYYFVTICTHKRECFFGEIIEEGMHLNSAGQMIASVWADMPRRLNKIGLDSFVVMPNHIHGIIVLEKGVALSRVVQAFKSISTNEYIRSVRQQGWKAFNDTLWQRSFYDHVIRNEEDLLRVQEYISNNPLKWSLDEENPNRAHPHTGYYRWS